MLLHDRRPIETGPLRLSEVATPEPGPAQVRLRVTACGICHTDLHVIEGDLPSHKTPLIPGHQIIGIVDYVGKGVTNFALGDRIGVPWLNETCGSCVFCKTGRENLCAKARFTGYDVDGGFAEYAVAPADFVYRMPDGFSDLDAAPLLCAGIIGFRALRLSEARPGMKIAMVGFGASAHIAIQVARHQGIRDVFVFTRSKGHRRLAETLGAVWAGDFDAPPKARFDAAIIFAPDGTLVPKTLALMEKGGVIALAGIHMSDIPSIRYEDLWGERTIRSVANLTRADGEGLLKAASEIPIRTHTTSFALEEANEALTAMKQSRIDGAGVIVF